MQQLLEIFMNLDTELEKLVTEYGTAIYAILFSIIFAETGLVVTPFLPGDSLLFTVGALAARGLFNPVGVTALLIVAAILGDAVNYHIGKWIGPKVFRMESNEGGAKGWLVKLLNKKHLERAHEFFERYGGKAIILARFVPIVRTFVPFVAGAGTMNYGRFVVYNVVGGVAWVIICILAGYLFGNIEAVKKHFELVVIGIIFVSLLPIAFEYMKSRRTKAA